MTWWRSRYVQHLEAENAELRETVKRMLNPQWRYLLYGTEVEVVKGSDHTTKVETKKENVKIPARHGWAQIRSQVEYLVSPQAIVDKKRSEREEHIHSVTERIG